MRSPEPPPSAPHYACLGDDPAAVRRLESDLDDAARALLLVGSEVRLAEGALRRAWPHGPAGDAAVRDVRLTVDFVGTNPPLLRAAARALGTYADQLVVERRRLDDLNEAHAVLAPSEARLAAIPAPPPLERLGEWEAADTDLRIARSLSGFRTTSEIDAAHAALLRRVRGHRDECAAVLVRARVGREEPGSSTGASTYAAQLALLAAGGLPTYLGRAGLAALPTDAVAVRSFWSGLTSVERAVVVAGDPRRVADLGGVPARDRDTANRLLLAADLAGGALLFRAVALPVPTTVAEVEREIARFGARTRRAAGEGAGGAGRSGALALTPAVLRRLAVLRNALAVRQALDRGRGPALLLGYDASAFRRGVVADGRAVISYGDPDEADDVAICVPGLESRVANLGDVGGDALALSGEARDADPTRSTAVVAWQGYDAPEFASVLSQSRAEAGGARLATDVHSLVVGHRVGDPTVTVVAHSYGSTTTGLALQHHGLAHDVDHVALVGSPGVGGAARSVTDLGLRDEQLSVGTASRDIINVTSDTLMGKSPLDPDFGGTRFRAESVDRDGPGFTDLVGEDDHLRYFDPGSESLYALGDIASGHPDRLAEHGMVAERPLRDHAWYDPPPLSPLPWPLSAGQGDVDPEFNRPPTGDHHHVVG